MQKSSRFLIDIQSRARDLEQVSQPLSPHPDPPQTRTWGLRGLPVLSTADLPNEVFVIETIEGHCSINESVKQHAQGPAVHLEHRDKTHGTWEADSWDSFQTVGITVCEQPPPTPPGTEFSTWQTGSHHSLTTDSSAAGACLFKNFLSRLSSLFLTAILWSRQGLDYFQLHLTDENTEAKGC
jgi:hypothetical protein